LEDSPLTNRGIGVILERVKLLAEGVGYMDNNHPLKSANYRRVSTDEQAKQGTSLSSQAAKLAQYCCGDTVIDYCDDGYSGVDGNRPALEKLLRDAQLHMFNRVVCTMLDRLARNLRLLLDLEAKLRDCGVHLVFIDQGVDTSKPMGKFMFQILSLISEWEHDTIIERTKQGRARRYAQGQWGPGQPLYGYKYNPDTKRLDIREEETSIVRRIYRLYVYDRLGLEQIARFLNSDHVPPRQQARLWHKSAIRDIITHPAYKGDHPSGVKVPVIIDETLWALAQKRRQDNPHLHRRRDSPWLLQGIVHCGLCGRILSCSYSHGVKGRRVYSCPGRRLQTRTAGAGRCGLPILDADWLEAEVWEQFYELANNPEAMAKVLRDELAQIEARKAQLEAELKPVEFKLEEVREKLARLAEEWVSRSLSQETQQRLRSELEAEEQRLMAAKGNLDPAQLGELNYLELPLTIYRNQLAAIEKGEQQDLSLIIDKVDNPRRALLDKFQTEVWAYPVRVELKLLCQGFSPDYRSGHYLQSR